MVGATDKRIGGQSNRHRWAALVGAASATYWTTKGFLATGVEGWNQEAFLFGFRVIVASEPGWQLQVLYLLPSIAVVALSAAVVATAAEPIVQRKGRSKPILNPTIGCPFLGSMALCFTLLVFSRPSAALYAGAVYSTWIVGVVFGAVARVRIVGDLRLGDFQSERRSRGPSAGQPEVDRYLTVTLLLGPLDLLLWMGRLLTQPLG